MDNVYPTKVDWWMGLILLITVLATFSGGVLLLAQPPAQNPVELAVGLLCLALAVWIGYIPFNTKYEIGDAELRIRSGGFRWHVPLESIIEVFPTHNPLSSPACSLDRLRVNYRNERGRAKFVMISPRRKDDFLRDLAEAAPRLTQMKDSLVRAAEKG